MHNKAARAALGDNYACPIVRKQANLSSFRTYDRYLQWATVGERI